MATASQARPTPSSTPWTVCTGAGVKNCGRKSGEAGGEEQAGGAGQHGRAPGADGGEDPAEGKHEKASPEEGGGNGVEPELVHDGQQIGLAARHRGRVQPEVLGSVVRQDQACADRRSLSEHTLRRR